MLKMIYDFIRSDRKATILTEHSSVHLIKICSTNVSGPHETQSQWFRVTPILHDRGLSFYDNCEAYGQWRPDPACLCIVEYCVSVIVQRMFILRVRFTTNRGSVDTQENGTMLTEGTLD